MKLYFGLLFVTAGLSLAGVSPSAAQDADQGVRELLRQQERDRALREQLEQAPEVRLQSPTAQQPARIPDDEAPCFPIQNIVLEGELASEFSWALDAANLASDPAKGRCLGASGIRVVMNRIEHAVVERGYVTTRILAAPQDLKGGTLQLTVVPGRLREVRFAPGTPARATLWNALRLRRGDLLNLRDIEQALENFQRIPTVQADIQIVPSEGEDAQPGDSDLVITWQQRVLPLRLNLSLDDSGSQTTGKLQGSLSVSLDNPLALNDLFYVSGSHDVSGHGKGTRAYSAHYSLPFGYWALGLTVSGHRYYQTVAGLNQNYVYSGTSSNAEAKLSRVMYRDASRKVGLYLRGWERQSNNYIDDTEVEVQRRRSAGWEVGLSHREYLGSAIFDAEIAWRRGTGAFGAIQAPEELFGEGTARVRVLSANAQFSVPFRLGSLPARYTGSWRAQWNRSPLVPQDRFSIGGRYTVRGFDGEMTLMGDRGWLLRNELGFSVYPGHELYLGADYGHVGGPSTVMQAGRSLGGAVLGVRGAAKGFSWDAFVGTPLHKPKGFRADSVVTGFTVTWSY